MAVDYTKVFTVIGSHLDKINDYKAQIATYTSDQAAIEAILAAQTLVRLEGDLVETYDSFKQDTSNHLGDLVNRITTVLTDEILIGANFSFGTSPNLQIVWPALIHDMSETDKNVAPNTATIGSITYDTQNTTPGVIEIGTILDGVTSPLAGALAIREYTNLVTQLIPTSEILTLTCASDSETGGIRGSEVFTITGTASQSDGYSSTGENIGQLGSIQVVDNQAGTFVSNSSFDSWISGELSNWDVDTGDTGIDYEEGTFTVVSGSGSSFKTIPAGTGFVLIQELSPSIFIRNKSYFLSIWAAKDTDTGTDGTLAISIYDDNDNIAVLSGIAPTAVSWEHFQTQFVIPNEIVGPLRIKIETAATDPGDDPIFIDQMVISPCEYHAGIAIAIYGGPDKFLIGDTISVPLSNDDAGKFQTLMRKAYKVQLPTDATPTISDSLVT